MTLLVSLNASLADRYRIDSEIGAGGMATVYRAHDLKHDRHVAIKVLRPELAAVIGAERFLAEIRTTANLQHPHILPLFDSGVAESFLFYVMPFIEGESLRDRLAREKQLAIGDALRIAREVADALDYAHRHGVIHRDIKPENILLHDGRALVADFGIALAASKAGGRMTETGMSLGTPSYMSPEQAMGERDLDARSDIYALGAVLYEMLSGEPPFSGPTAQAIVAKVMTAEPVALHVLRKTVPPAAEAATLRALEKLPADRFASAAEFAAALSDERTPAPVSHGTRVSQRPRAVRAAPWIIAAAMLLIAVTGWRMALRPAADAIVVRYEIPFPANSGFAPAGGSQVAISRNGRLIAYVTRQADGTRRIMLRASEELQARVLAGSENGASPFFSPDGSMIAFYANQQIVKMPVTGGRAEVISELPGMRGAGSWSTTGWIVASNGRLLTKTPAAGGAAQPFTRINSTLGEAGQENPLVLSDGKTVLYTSTGMGGAVNAHIGVASLDDSSTTILEVTGTMPLGVLDGYLVYTNAGGTVMAAPFDQRNRKITGPSITFVDQAAVSGVISLSLAQMTADGAFVYVSGITRRQMVLVGSSGTSTTLGEPGSYGTPRFSPDGKRIAVSVGGLSQRDVWLYELPSGPFTRFTTVGTINDRPEWTPDGKAILFRSNRSGRNSLWLGTIGTGFAATPLFGRGDSQIDEGVLSPDGNYLLFQRDTVGSGEVWYRGMGADTAQHLVHAGAGTYGARFSPDGKWIVYTSTESGTEQVYVRAFPSLASQFQVSLSGGSTPVWSADGKRIYFGSGGQLIAASVGASQPFAITSREVVLARGYGFNTIHADYDVAPDGRSVIALQSPSQDVQLVVVRNFGAELAARVRGTPK